MRWEGRWIYLCPNRPSACLRNGGSVDVTAPWRFGSSPPSPGVSELYSLTPLLLLLPPTSLLPTESSDAVPPKSQSPSFSQVVACPLPPHSFSSGPAVPLCSSFPPFLLPSAFPSRGTIPPPLPTARSSRGRISRPPRLPPSTRSRRTTSLRPNRRRIAVLSLSRLFSFALGARLAFISCVHVGLRFLCLLFFLTKLIFDCDGVESNRSIDLRSLQAQNAFNVASPPTSRATNYIVLRYYDAKDDPQVSYSFCWFFFFYKFFSFCLKLIKQALVWHG